MTNHVTDQRSKYEVKHSLSKNSKRVITDDYARKLVKLAEKQELRRKLLPERQEKKKTIKQELAAVKKQLFELTQKASKSFKDYPKYTAGMDGDFYRTKEWRSLRWDVISKANGKCLVCGKSNKEHGVIMHVDHIKPRSKFPELELVKSNMQLLCEECNIGKGAKIQTF